MTEGFLNVVEREARTESDRVISELSRLKFEASQVIHVLNALNLDIPQELRELAPIEQVPTVTVDIGPQVKQVLEEVIIHEPVAKRGGAGTPGQKARVERAKAKAAKRTEDASVVLKQILSKGPMNPNDVRDRMKELGYGTRITENAFNLLGDGVRSERVKTYQGGNLWLLVERPVSLETLRDNVVKEKGDIPLEELWARLGFRNTTDLMKMMDELVAQGILGRLPEGEYVNPVQVKDKRTKDEQTRDRRIRRNGAVAGTGRGAKLSSDKEVRQILEKAESMGAQVKKKGNDHIEVTYRGNKRVLASTPGDSNRSNREKLKNLGINV